MVVADVVVPPAPAPLELPAAALLAADPNEATALLYKKKRVFALKNVLNNQN